MFSPIRQKHLVFLLFLFFILKLLPSVWTMCGKWGNICAQRFHHGGISTSGGYNWTVRGMLDLSVFSMLSGGSSVSRTAGSWLSRSWKLIFCGTKDVFLLPELGITHTLLKSSGQTGNRPNSAQPTSVHRRPTRLPHVARLLYQLVARLQCWRITIFVCWGKKSWRIQKWFDDFWNATWIMIHKDQCHNITLQVERHSE